ncbi:MAG: hypothetical protein K8F54_08900 [Altibacter sp.]|uniref:hypothetical protein n=1 Tax=Altibacter sp. TaxID=2024823 RepID=UPI001DAFDCAE|nr:hypothetical protein [Altibacter sp.]MBZ0327707.1 hypothetical protein [Altibacter sp.]
MKLYPFLMSVLMISTVVLIACGKASEEQVGVQAENINWQGSFGTKGADIPALSEAVKNQIIQWSVFEDFEKEARSINGSTLDKLRNTSERLVHYSDSLSKKIPDTLRNNAVRSRLTVVNTRANMLFQEVRKSRIDSLEVERAIAEMNKATHNLFVQLNEKFQKDAIDLQRKDDEEKELEKQKKFLDSVYKEELRDKNN